MRLLSLVLLVAAGAVISACATLSKSECQIVDWRQLGESDGQAGHKQTRLAAHSKACEKHGSPVDREGYNDGWRSGIVRFCTPQNGFNRGQSGASYSGSCPAELSGAFIAAYTPAKRSYDAERRIRNLESNIDSGLAKLQRLASSTKPEDKRRLREVDEQIRRDRGELPRARFEAEQARRDLDAFLRDNPDIRGF